MQNTKTFSLEIEKMAQEKSITHMDAVLEYCKRKEIEPESVTRLISKSLKDKIEANARDLNYQKAFVNAIYTSKTRINTRIKGQDGYKKNEIFDKMSEAEKMYKQYKWIIK